MTRSPDIPCWHRDQRFHSCFTERDEGALRMLCGYLERNRVSSSGCVARWL